MNPWSLRITFILITIQAGFGLPTHVVIYDPYPTNCPSISTFYPTTSTSNYPQVSQRTPVTTPTPLFVALRKTYLLDLNSGTGKPAQDSLISFGFHLQVLHGGWAGPGCLELPHRPLVPDNLQPEFDQVAWSCHSQFQTSASGAPSRFSTSKR